MVIRQIRVPMFPGTLSTLIHSSHLLSTLLQSHSTILMAAAAQGEVFWHLPPWFLGSPCSSSSKTVQMSQSYTHFFMRKQQRHVFLFCLQQRQVTLSQLLLQKHASQLNLLNFQSFEIINLIFALMSAFVLSVKQKCIGQPDNVVEFTSQLFKCHQN